jgi:hypothetical protein
LGLRKSHQGSNWRIASTSPHWAGL